MGPRFAAAAMVAMLVSGLPPTAARADEIHLTNGEVLYGLLQKEDKTSYAFLEVDGKRPKKVSKRTVERVVLTYSLPDFVFNDPRWSETMVEERLADDLDPGWGEFEALRSEHYIVFTNSDAGPRYLETMEDIYEKFRALFPFEELPGARLMPVFLFKTKEQYYEFLVRNIGMAMEAARRTAGVQYLDFYATYYAAPGAPIHYHEGAHQLVQHRLGLEGGGSWFQEGMAVYFEGTIFPGEDPEKGMKGVVKSGRHMPFREFFVVRSLLGSTDTGRDSTLAHQRYQQAGATIKFLAEGPYAARFPKMLEGVRKRHNWSRIVADVYDMEIDELEAAFVEHYGG